LGNAVHSSWNFFPKEKIQFQTALERYKVNREIKMRSLVPLFTLMIDILNFEMYYLDIELIKFCDESLQEFFRLSNIQYSKLLSNPLYSRIPILKELEAQNVVVCENCFDEIFNFWIYAEKFTGIKRDKYDTILCPACFEKEFKYIDQSFSVFISYKYETQDLKKLFERVKKRVDIELGNEPFGGGEIEDELQISLAKFNKDTRFNAKIKADFIQQHKNDLNLTAFFNKKNPIFMKIPAIKVLEHIQSNFAVLAEYQKPMHNEFTEQLASIGNYKLQELLKGRKKSWAQIQNDKSNFAVCEVGSHKDKENKHLTTKLEDEIKQQNGFDAFDNAHTICDKKNHDNNTNESSNKNNNNNNNIETYNYDNISENDSLFDFYEKTNLKLFDGNIEDANLGGAGSNKIFKENKIFNNSKCGESHNENLNKG